MRSILLGLFLTLLAMLTTTLNTSLAATLYRVSSADVGGGLEQDHEPSWSADGDSIVAHTLFRIGEGTIAFSSIWTSVGSPPTPVAGFSAQPDWSPDGSKIVLWRNSGSATEVGIWVYPREGSVPLQILDLADRGYSPAWHPNNVDLVYLNTSEENLWRVNTQTGVKSQLTSHADREVSPAWSPDGTKVAFASNRSGNWDIWVIDVASAVEAQVTSDPSTELDPGWSPDGKWLAFTSHRSGNADIWVQDSMGLGAAAQITTNPASDQEPDWSPDGNAIAFASDRASSDVGFRIWVVEDFVLPETVSVTRETMSGFKSRFRE